MTASIPHDALVVICDAAKALFLRNTGTSVQPHLNVEHVETAPSNPRNREQGSDRPGRLQNAIGPTSAVETKDWRSLADLDFARNVAHRLKSESDRLQAAEIVIVAPPPLLAALRRLIDARLRDRVKAEIHRDLNKHPLLEIERILANL
ncbi:host attachment family protein [Bosea sp. TND4EK4]|uniref:baeRF12 domain-containing protein n=1 Tax=Bosea sp. TND4EK4 TaxID=1907408 RepID=UPI000956E11D|nr:host attachment family protein [Bosea sp. TND4EK4]SIP88480.1 Protein required for attachment to host cells [Bosea sp. TND4EK4]